MINRKVHKGWQRTLRINVVFDFARFATTIQQTAGMFRLSASSSINYNIPEAKGIADMLALEINQLTGFSFKTQQVNTGTIHLNINKTPVEKTGN